MSDIVKFRPKARIIHTLGSEIIKDAFSAIIELVKNSYDADAKYVIVKFDSLNNREKAKIIVSDDGHGMSYDIVSNVWMIPGTIDKIDRKFSPNGRILLGAKGIGRLAAGRIGSQLTLETTNNIRETTILKINWDKLNENKFLDEIEFVIYRDQKKKEPGTEIIIESIGEEWFKEETINSLIKELRKLLSPVRTKKEKFEIYIDFEESGISSFERFTGDIKPYPVLEYFDYRLWGKVFKDGTISLRFQNGILKNLPVEKIKESIDIKRIDIKFDEKKGLSIGDIFLDIRVFDRDPDSIDELIRRSNLKGENEKFLGKREAKKLLDDLSGIGIFREEFRLRPYGDAGYDWLELDKERVQNPTLRIGSDQVSGYIRIGSESETGLKEKSSREGFFENQNYYDLIKIITYCLSFLEEKRFSFRKKSGRGRTTKDIGLVLNEFLSFDKLQSNITKKLKSNEAGDGVIKDIKSIITNELETKTKDFVKIQETIALYEGQVTLGKIVGVLMHEGRKPVKYIDEQAPRITKWYNHLLKQNLILTDDFIFSREEILERLDGLKKESELLITLFKKVDPLAVKRRKISVNIPINEVVQRSKILFESELRKNQIRVKTNFRKTFYTKGVESDIYIILTNLFDNSIYWLSTLKKNEKRIEINLFYEEDDLILDFIDNGPGIKEEFVDSLFEPGFSTRPRGTGLGLSISGEAATRNGGTIKLMDYKEGAYFRITLQRGKES